MPPEEYLSTVGGLRPLLASALCAPTPRHVHMAAWALLLGQLATLASASVQARVVRQALREVPTLVPSFLNSLLDHLPLAQHMGGAKPPATAAPTTGEVVCV